MVLKIPACSLAVISCLLSPLAGCRSRQFNTDGRALSNQAPSSAGTSVVAGDLLADDPKYPATTNPPSNYAEDAIVSVPDASGKAFLILNNVLTDEGTSVPDADLEVYKTSPFNALTHEKFLRTLLASNTRSTPVPLAAASTLTLLRRNRDAFVNPLANPVLNLSRKPYPELAAVTAAATEKKPSRCSST